MLSQLSIQKTARSRLPEVDFANLGFGGVYADHMFLLDYADGAWGAPRIVPYGPLSLPPGVAGLHYGQSVFEGLKAFRGVDGRIRLFRPEANARRLTRSCERLCIPPLPESLFVEAIERLVALDQDWIPEGRGASLYIRPLILATEEHLDVRPSRRFLFVVMTAPARAYFRASERGVSLLVQEEYTRAAPGGTGFAKTGGNYAASLLPGQVSQQAGYDQVLWLDGREHRYVEEVGQMNIFFCFKDRIVTPPLRGTILPGVTRDSILTLLREQDRPVFEEPLAIDDVLAALAGGDLLEVFGAGTAAVVVPVGRIGYRGHDVEVPVGGEHSLTRALYRQLTAIQYGEAADTRGWSRVLEPASAPTAA
ncbi:MAG: branched-chain amino acid aminotransferase [Candidatus Competibacterales bacterium]|nr:branched-chain amino acid aminotransferase [Candidatus Competibacterales bacterium]